MRWYCVWSPGRLMLAKGLHWLIKAHACICCSTQQWYHMLLKFATEAKARPRFSVCSQTYSSLVMFKAVVFPYASASLSHPGWAQVGKQNSGMCPLHPPANCEGCLGSLVETSAPTSSLPSSQPWGLEMPPVQDPWGGSRRDRAAVVGSLVVMPQIPPGMLTVCCVLGYRLYWPYLKTFF